MRRDHARAGITLNMNSQLNGRSGLNFESSNFFPKQTIGTILNIQFLRPVIIVARAHDGAFLWKQSVDLGQLV